MEGEVGFMQTREKGKDEDTASYRGKCSFINANQSAPFWKRTQWALVLFFYPRNIKYIQDFTIEMIKQDYWESVIVETGS